MKGQSGYILTSINEIVMFVCWTVTLVYSSGLVCCVKIRFCTYVIALYILRDIVCSLCYIEMLTYFFIFMVLYLNALLPLLNK
jgi:hypothetical protein